MSNEDEIKILSPRAIIGFDGSVKFGLKAHPNGKNIIYPLGSKISISELGSYKQEFLVGHSNAISTLDISPSGKYIASGESGQLGFRAFVIIWDFEKRKEMARHDLHKGKVQGIIFTAEDKYIVSIGGQDDGTVVVYELKTMKPICRSPASQSVAGSPSTVIRLHKKSTIFLTAGNVHFRMWTIKPDERKLSVTNVSVGKIRRNYVAMKVDKNDENLYVSTMTGDIIKVKINCSDSTNASSKSEVPVLIGAYAVHNQNKPKYKDCEKYFNGVRDIFIVKSDNPTTLLIGAGDGTVELVEERKNVCFKDYKEPTWPNLKSLYKNTVSSPISSITPIGHEKFLIGTEESEVYMLNLKTFEFKLLLTSHKSQIYDIQFPKGFSQVFATSGYESIRIWSTARLQELLRIIVFNFTCAAIKFTTDGHSILSAWNDGVLRAFTPITGKLIWAIPNAHNKGCTAITISQNGRIMISGGVEGQVRVWKIEPFRQSLIGVLKEHSAPISTVDFNKFDTEVVSASQDGSCVIWDINRMTRKHVFYANTQFLSALYFPTAVQILTSGTDHRICYWEVYDASLAREVEGSSTSINCLSLNTSGEYFVAGSTDSIVKLWDYQKGIPLCQGNGHATAVIAISYSPCGKFFISGDMSGTIVVWNIPKDFWPKYIDPLNVSSADETLSRRSSSKASIDIKRPLGSGKKERIEELESSRSKKDIRRAECPPVDKKAQPDVNENCNCIARDAPMPLCKVAR
ncbi:cilia- and flagella-associated protein 52 [Condylostylus longicornis]|uniref:cilia- and flagella-associated protein 52 n=1 Tax=Condylostylus longicornis TaxID=2530218 RepID=UPI00244E4F81|nr:cilia- and flagella-associated protein 52 [Condylostylus longicornis]